MNRLQLVFILFTASQYSKYYAIKWRILENLFILSFGRYQHIVEKYYVSCAQITTYGIGNYILVPSCEMFEDTKRGNKNP